MFTSPQRPDEKLILGLINMARRSFGDTMPENDVREVLARKGTLFVAIDSKDEPVGFANTEYAKPIVHLSGGVVGPEHQGNGLYTLLTLTRLCNGISQGCYIVTTHTQNPVIEYTIANSLKMLVRSGDIRNFDLLHRLAPNRYGRMLTKAMPHSKDESINRMYGKLNYARGDAYELLFVTGVVR